MITNMINGNGYMYGNNYDDGDNNDDNDGLHPLPEGLDEENLCQWIKWYITI